MSSLFGPEALNPRTRFPHLSAVFDACERFAMPVAQGFMDLKFAQHLLQNCKLVLDQEPHAPDYQGIVHPGRPGQSQIAQALRDGVRSCMAKRCQTERAVCRDLAPLLDQRADAETLRNAGRAADLEDVLLPEEHRALIAREQAWWVRLHVAIGGEHDLAA